MKRNLFTIIFVLILSFGLNAQVTTFFDDFSGGDLTNFTVINNDGGSYTWEYNATEGVGGTDCARLHWESAAHDDWLISPQITVGVDTRFSVDAQNDAGSFNDSCYVKISTTTNEIASFTVTLDTITTSDGTGTDAYTTFDYDLSAYDGEDIYIAIVGFTTDQFYFNVDNFNVYLGDPMVTFNVNMADSIASGYFIEGTDQLWLAGTMNAWVIPGDDAAFEMFESGTDDIYTLTLPLADASYEYKYFKIVGGVSSWDNGEWPETDNRSFTVAGDDLILNDIYGQRPVGIEELSLKGISVYPNPSNGEFNISVENNFNLEIFDITGKIINTQVLIGNSTVSIDKAGLYFLRFSNEQGSVTQRVIVQ